MDAPQPSHSSPPASDAAATMHGHPPPRLPDNLLRWAREQCSAGVPPAALQTALQDAGWDGATAAAVLSIAHAWPAHAPQERAPDRAGEPGPDLHGAPPHVDADGHRVSIVARLASPPLVLFSNLLAAGECQALIAAARPRLARSLTVETQGGGEAVNADRTSEGMFFARGETALVARLEQRIAALLQWPVDRGEGLQVLRYGPGAEYRPHYDYFDPAEPGTTALLRRGGQRVATLIMYLNTPEAGGATVFPDLGLEVAPQQGHAVFFSYARPHPDTRSLHGGAPVQAGEKWIATKWLREGEFF